MATGDIKAKVEPWTYKAIFAVLAGALGEVAHALARIAAEYERRGAANKGGDDG